MAAPDSYRAPVRDPDGGAFTPGVLELSDPEATDVALTGVKAANLARSRAAGLPVIDGFVITTAAFGPDLDGVGPAGQGNPVWEAWSRHSGAGDKPLAVRSSSVAEDTEGSSMAGQFTSVLHVLGWDDFVAAVDEVVASATVVGSGTDPIAVLVQPMAEAIWGGVLFGLNPLTGNRNRFLASVVAGLPELIVSGEDGGTTLEFDRFGALRTAQGAVHDVLPARRRRALVRLATRTERIFGSPQDMEWLIEPDGTLRLLQSRPITASAVPAPRSHPWGPGPVAETFPDPLSTLEQELWVPPLEDGIRAALKITGALPRRQLRRPFVMVVDGRVAVDLQVLGVVRPKASFWRVFDVREPARHLMASWRVGRLRAALPDIVADLAAEIDGELGELPSLDGLGDQQLLTLLDNARLTLVGAHAHEVLCGFFVTGSGSITTAASVAVATVAKARIDGIEDAEIVSRHPVALALLPPRIGGQRPLPPTPEGVHAIESDEIEPLATARESMRLRSRWLQELTARVALELGRRLVRRGQLRLPEDVRFLERSRLVELVHSLDIAASVGQVVVESAPLPRQFRLSPDGKIVPDTSDPGTGGPRGVSPGRARARLTHDPLDSAGAILQVGSLNPSLASLLPDLAGLIAETGSPLSHLAILAREYGVPTVVGYTGTLPQDGLVLIDGTAGTVDVVHDDDVDRPAGSAGDDVRSR